MNVLRADNLAKRYKSRQVVTDASIRVASGEVVGLLGPNGAGKTTCFYMLVGLIRAQSGQIRLDDIDLTNMPVYKRARLGLSYLPQEPSIFRRLSVADNIAAMLELCGHNAAEVETRLENLLDEPFAGIDPISVIDIQKIVGFLTDRGIGVLITDHNVRETLGICNRAYILNAGQVLAAGTPEEIIYNEDVRKVYLGEHFRL